MPISRLNLLILLAVLLAACGPAPAATPTFTTAPILPSATPPPSQTPTTTASPTLPPTATPAPELSPTPRPHYDLHDMSTWSQEMQAYYQRDPAEWNNPTQEYMSDDEFHSQLISMRREYLAQQGIEGADTMNEQELFLAYVRHGYEHPGEILKLSPVEKRNIMTGPFMPGYRENGIRVPGIMIDNDLPSRPTEEWFNEITSDEYAQMNNHVFGELISFDRPSYSGTIATLVGLVESVGRRTDNSVECLMYYEQEGQGYWAIISVAFTPELHLAGEEFVSLEYGFKTFHYAENTEGIPIHTGVSSTAATLQDFINHIGARIWLKAGGPNTQSQEQGLADVATELSAAGIECAPAVVFDNVPQPEAPELPWNP